MTHEEWMDEELYWYIQDIISEHWLELYGDF